MLKITGLIAIGLYIGLLILEIIYIAKPYIAVGIKEAPYDVKSPFGIRRKFLDTKYVGVWKLIPDKINQHLISTEGDLRVFFSYDSEERFNKQSGKDYDFYYDRVHLYLYDPKYSSQGFVSIVQPVRFKRINMLKSSLDTLDLIKVSKDHSDKNYINFIRSYRNPTPKLEDEPKTINS